jgi:peptidoglycan/xylan/chitin deacetylase (PgdA/CDA1 family)
MMALAKRVGLSVMSTAGLPRTLHRLAFRDHVSILMYHAVVHEPLAVDDWCFLSRDAFAEQLRYLKQYFEIIPLRDAARRIATRSITRPTAVLTFDDGFQNNYDVVFPMLKAEGAPASMFLTTDLIDTDGTLWFCRLNRALAETTESSFSWDGRRFSTANPAEKARTSGVIQSRLKEFAPPRFSVELEAVLVALGDDPGRGVEPGSPFRMLSSATIREMAGSGLVEFGAHTCSHVLLSQVRGDRLQREIGDSVDAVTGFTGQTCRQFSYPNGRAQDYNAEALAVLQARGIDLAVTAITGPNTEATPGLELRRYGIGADTTHSRFQSTVHHFFDTVRGRGRQANYKAE